MSLVDAVGRAGWHGTRHGLGDPGRRPVPPARGCTNLDLDRTGRTRRCLTSRRRRDWSRCCMSQKNLTAARYERNAGPRARAEKSGVVVHEQSYTEIGGRDEVWRVKCGGFPKRWPTVRGYDMRAFTPDGRERLMRLKRQHALGTHALCYISRNELAFGPRAPAECVLVRTLELLA